VLLVSLAWLEYSYHHRCSHPRALAVWMAAYTIAVLAGGALWGRDWIEEDEGFAGLLSTVGTMGVFRAHEGRIRARAPLTGLGEVQTAGGTLALLCVSIGSTLFAVLLTSRLWTHVSNNRSGWSLTAVNTTGLALTIAVVGGVYLACLNAVSGGTERSQDELMAATGRGLVPVAVGLVVAAGFFPFLIDVQNAYALVSDPFGRGWDLFGTIDINVHYTVVRAATIAWTQVVSLTALPLAGLVVAHDGMLRTTRPARAIRALPALVVLFTAFAAGSVALFLGA
jgi:hypothetical protein